MKYGFIGCGNMGGALIGAAAKAVNPSDIYINDHDVEKMTALAKNLGVVTTDIKTLARESDMIFLGVKPQSMEEMLGGIRDILEARVKDGESCVLVSMAAALSIDRIRGMLKTDKECAEAEYTDKEHTDLVEHFPVIRIMPNLAAAVGEGMMLYCSDGASDKEVECFKNLMAPSGKLLKIDEELMDAGCAVSGCGPAFAYMFIDAMARGGEECGLSREDSILLATQTVLGAARNMRESGKAPEELVKAVCSPGGTTIEGVKSLEAGDFCDEVGGAVRAAYKRAKEM